MKVRCWAINSALLLLAASGSALAASNEAKNFGLRYAKAETEGERLRIGIEAIEQGVICQRCKIEDFDAIFGTDFAKADMRTEDSRGLLNEVVWFDSRYTNVTIEPATANDAPSSASIAGWRIGVRFSPDGTIMDYSITNVDKFSF